MSQVRHSDVIGSLLRPRYLTQARDAFAAGQLSAPEFKRTEDRAVDQAIAMQEGVGLDVVTDGELRRFSFLDQIVGEIDGMEPSLGMTFAVHVCKGNNMSQWIVAARIHEAAKYTGLERLGVSTQRGFSSTLPGANLTNEGVQERKLELVAEVAATVW